jgi:hypothetical protein
MHRIAALEKGLSEEQLARKVHILYLRTALLVNIQSSHYLPELWQSTTWNFI